MHPLPLLLKQSSKMLLCAFSAELAATLRNSLFSVTSQADVIRPAYFCQKLISPRQRRGLFSLYGYDAFYKNKTFKRVFWYVCFNPNVRMGLKERGLVRGKTSRGRGGAWPHTTFFDYSFILNFSYLTVIKVSLKFQLKSEIAQPAAAGPSPYGFPTYLITLISEFRYIVVPKQILMSQQSPELL